MRPDADLWDCPSGAPVGAVAQLVGWLGLVRAGWTGLAGWIWGLAGALLVDYLFLFKGVLLVKEKILDPKTPDAESVVIFQF